MGLVRTIARRFLFNRNPTKDKGSQGFVSFIAAISIAGLALGATALLVVTSVMNGFERELERVLTSFHGHIILFSRGEPLSDPDQYLKEIPEQFPDVEAITPYIFSEVMLSSSKGVAGSVVEGIHPPTIDRVSPVGKKIIEGRLPQAQDPEKPPEITLGAELARKLKAKPGDTVVLTVPFAKSGEAPLVQKLQVAGIVKLGMHEYDSKYALMEISALQKILGLTGKVNAFKILTRNASKSLATTESLNEKYVYPLRARDWSSLNRNMFYAIRLEKVVIAIILMAIVLVASFNIISTILMMVHDKRAQISMLKALGLSRKSVFYLFLLIGTGLSTLGMILGVGLGRALCALVAWKSIIDLPADVYMFSRLPIEIRPWEWVVISVLTVLLAVASTLWPSYRISQESPVEGLRYE